MAWNFGDEVQFGGGECHGARYMYITLLLPCGRSRLLQRRGRVFAFRSCGPPRAVGIFLHPLTFGGQCGGRTHDIRVISTSPPVGAIVVERKYFTCPSRESNPERWIYRETLYHVAVKAGFYRKAVEVY